MSSSRGKGARGKEFETWIADKFADTGGFTALILLLAIGSDKVSPISCSYVHVIGDEIAWKDMKTMLDASGHKWSGFAIFPEAAPGGGPLIDIVAKARLQDRIDQVTADRMTLNAGGLFDALGRAIRIDPVGVH